ncbi:hypothetical protein LCGC14_2363120 [marine sediment metagenome]|uniref:Uncharacterized protein n=1 Tax=marine sediment metagenome TaxID=412755 RepID=A0A0F9F0S7_9ZZZZ
MNESNNPSILDQALDNLSKIPWLKMIMKIMWITSTVYLGIAIIIECIALFMHKVVFRPELIKNIILYTTINPFFGYIFYRWNKRESVSQMKKNN